MDAIVLVSGLVAIAAGNAAWWWRQDKDLQARLTRLQAQLKDARASAFAWEARAVKAEWERRELAEEKASLQERNRMLSDLIGEDRT
ncbi:hypothetical protein [Nonomuraea sp. GTA35]|uniref:hypothetical protein n=1 Tax=Nonomuraea sp. GTA35 TaxID=1676746 RepID=UPI0035C1E5F3